MKHRLFLRIAAVCMLIHFLGHTWGHFLWKDTPDPGAQAVIKAMVGYRFPFMGVERSMADYYVGFSWFVVLMLAVSAVWLWVLAARPVLDRVLLWPLALLLLGFGLIELTHFFPFAAAMSLLAALCVLVPLLRKAP
ncbi:MAG: hypothetical protein JST66_10110 [Bacteroidetes bacterium]|nr:hypothetical protein [Bacteroidota bacterium]